MDLDPGGVCVDANSDAAEGFAFRYGRESCDSERGWPSRTGRLFVGLTAEAAVGKVWSEAEGETSWSGDCIETRLRCQSAKAAADYKLIGSISVEISPFGVGGLRGERAGEVIWR